MSIKLVVISALATAALCAGGCPALMVGSLAYQGYKYHETGKLPGMPDNSSSSSSTGASSSSSKKSSTAPAASNIE
jgi:hypothetical protein